MQAGSRTGKRDFFTRLSHFQCIFSFKIYTNINDKLVNGLLRGLWELATCIPTWGDGIPGAILTDRVDVYVRNYVGVMHLIDDADCRRLRFVDRSHQLHATCALLLIPVFFFLWKYSVRCVLSRSISYRSVEFFSQTGEIDR
jgi:hypothetical protein